MGTDTSIPWYNVPARPFPVHVWMLRRYGFIVPPLRCAPPAQRPVWPRPFPATVWLERQSKRC